MDSTGAAVLLRNAHKSYSSLVLFKNLGMTVQCGAIYGLLGASGCGKTTLLKCIIGKSRLDHGTVLTLGKRPGGRQSGIPGKIVGYMPQETAIFENLTIAETLEFYGAVAGMSKNEVRQKIDFFLDFLAMPSRDTINNKCSGGQLRRLSFLVALIHSPKLVLLDEPTVGIDPIIRERIWEYLKRITAEASITVILTTHYIEEACNASCVGLMRGGRLLAEGSPLVLMGRFSCESLEDVFLKACQRLSHGEETPEASEYLSSDDVSSDRNYVRPKMIQRHVMDHFQIPKPACLLALVQKNIISYIRFPGAVFFIFAMPSILFAAAALALDKPSAGRITTVGILNEDLGSLGQDFLDHVDIYIRKETFTSYDSVREALLNGQVKGVMHIKQNFSASFSELVLDWPRFSGGSSRRASVIDVIVTGADFYADRFIRLASETGFLNFSETVFQRLSGGPSPLVPNVILDSATTAWLKLPVRISNAPTLLILFPYMMQMASCVLSLFVDKENGHLDRYFTSGVTPIECLSAICITQVGIIIIQCTTLFTIVFVALEIPLRGSLLLVFCLVALSALAGSSQGIFWTAAFDSITTMCVYGMSFSFIILGISGTVLPLTTAPYFFRVIVSMLPFYYPSVALYGVMYRNWGLTHPSVVLAIIILLGWFCFHSALAIVSFRMSGKQR